MTLKKHGDEFDGLRLIGLGRIPTCSTCPRYAGLIERYMNPRLGGSGLADVPRRCDHAYCAPIAARFQEKAEPLLEQRRSAS
jgi:hypothetical protein